jgi:hypothetical protein
VVHWKWSLPRYPLWSLPPAGSLQEKLAELPRSLHSNLASENLASENLSDLYCRIARQYSFPDFNVNCFAERKSNAQSRGTGSRSAKNTLGERKFVGEERKFVGEERNRVVPAKGKIISRLCSSNGSNRCNLLCYCNISRLFAEQDVQTVRSNCFKQHAWQKALQQISFLCCNCIWNVVHLVYASLLHCCMASLSWQPCASFRGGFPFLGFLDHGLEVEAI